MLKRLEVVGFKSFAKKTALEFGASTTAIVGPNGSGKSNIAEAFRFALGEQSMKSMRGKRAEDLIWGGSHSMPRASRAGVVIAFDNAPRAGKRPFNIDFDEVAIERVVHRDGVSEYSINSSRVRLRDVQELLAGANIGQTEHHIISQGEADRVLLASPRERRALLEDALGLRIYEFKKREAAGKLLKTEENIMQVNALRRELAPHLRFLARQVEKLERADGLRRELVVLAQSYFATEDAYLAAEAESVRRARLPTRRRAADSASCAKRSVSSSACATSAPRSRASLAASRVRSLLQKSAVAASRASPTPRCRARSSRRLSRRSSALPVCRAPRVLRRSAPPLRASVRRYAPLSPVSSRPATISWPKRSRR